MASFGGSGPARCCRTRAGWSGPQGWAAPPRASTGAHSRRALPPLPSCRASTGEYAIGGARGDGRPGRSGSSVVRESLRLVVDRHQPPIRARMLAANQCAIRILDRASHWAGAPGSDDAEVDLSQPDHLGGGAADELFVGRVGLVARGRLGGVLVYL